MKVKCILQRQGIWGIVPALRMAKIAIFETGGKQYLVSAGSVVDVEKLEIPESGDISFDKVLLVDDAGDTKVGAPYIGGAKISAELVSQGRAKKVTVMKYLQKSRYYKKRGHRQPFSKVRITKLP